MEEFAVLNVFVSNCLWPFGDFNHYTTKKNSSDLSNSCGSSF